MLLPLPWWDNQRIKYFYYGSLPAPEENIAEECKWKFIEQHEHWTDYLFQMCVFFPLLIQHSRGVFASILWSALDRVQVYSLFHSFIVLVLCVFFSKKKEKLQNLLPFTSFQAKIFPFEMEWNGIKLNGFFVLFEIFFFSEKYSWSWNKFCAFFINKNRVHNFIQAIFLFHSLFNYNFSFDLKHVILARSDIISNQQNFTCK